MAAARAESLSPDQEALLREPHLAQLTTLMPDGSPQTTPVWIDVNDGLIWVNTAEGRVKHRNVLRDPRVSVAVVHNDNHYRWVAVRGTVVEVTREGADDHIDAMAKKYLGHDRYPWHQPDQHRVLVKIKPENVIGQG